MTLQWWESHCPPLGHVAACAMTEPGTTKQSASRLPSLSLPPPSAACSTPLEGLCFREPAGNESQEASTSGLAEHSDGLTFLGVRVVLASSSGCDSSIAQKLAPCGAAYVRRRCRRHS